MEKPLFKSIMHSSLPTTEPAGMASLGLYYEKGDKLLRADKRAYSDAYEPSEVAAQLSTAQ
jgi:hypothetical protein